MKLFTVTTYFTETLNIDNFRTKSIGEKTIVIAIDFGCAASLQSHRIGALEDYHKPVGASAFAPLETLAGMADIRGISKKTDVYALGCMFFSLFNSRHFFFTLKQQIPDFESITLILIAKLQPLASKADKVRIELWNKEISKFKFLLKPPHLMQAGNDLPKSASFILNRAFTRMTDHNFISRTEDLSLILKDIDSAIRTIQNQNLYIKKSTERKLIRKNRNAKILKQQKVLRKYLLSKKAEHELS